MVSRLNPINVFVALVIAVGTASEADAQTGTIVGSVRDGTGAVLPGVTVEASSLALIEKVRSVTTDTSGGTGGGSRRRSFLDE